MVKTTDWQGFTDPTQAGDPFRIEGSASAGHGQLCADHDRMTSSLHLACAALRENRAAEANRFFTRFIALLETHMRSEEGELFPKLAEMGQPIHRELLDELLREHETVRVLVAAIRSDFGQSTASLSKLEKLLRTLSSHESKEEMYVYPMIFHLARSDSVAKRYRNKHVGLARARIDRD
jgi:hemerythrin superfamily protein